MWTCLNFYSQLTLYIVGSTCLIYDHNLMDSQRHALCEWSSSCSWFHWFKGSFIELQCSEVLFLIEYETDACVKWSRIFFVLCVRIFVVFHFKLMLLPLYEEIIRRLSAVFDVWTRRIPVLIKIRFHYYFSFRILNIPLPICDGFPLPSSVRVKILTNFVSIFPPVEEAVPGKVRASTGTRK